ncbi:MAG TPA: glycoside hydrolase family 28 protein [Pyrinomonadaceae bacterium]|nr:glycoside hydrolase family 28 protein [Pyrinomonadaceae bacterium]
MQERRDFIKLFGIGAAGVIFFPSPALGQADPWKTEYPKILSRIIPPKFPKRDFSILKFGAKTDGKTLATDAINGAITAANKAGGGRVVVPAGEFLTGAIHLRSNVNLHISKGATLKFTTDTKAYPTVFSRWEGMECMNFSPFIYAYEQQNIAITGEGTLDGQADNSHWWPWKGNKRDGWVEGNPRQHPDRDELYRMMEKGVPVRERVFGHGHYLRPQFIQPYKCKNVLVEGVTILRSPMWEVHPVLCENVTVRKIRVETHGPNNDGCNPESCKDVLIEDCYFDTGDDCIAIKSGRNEDGRRRNVPSENIIVRNCIMKEGHGGITIGSEISGGFRNLFAHDCQLDSPDLWTALRVKNNASRGGRIENVFFKKITVGTVSRAVVEIDFNYEEGSKGGHTPVVRNYVVEDLKCVTGNRAVDLQGLDNAPLYDIRMTDCDFGSMKNPSIVKNVRGLKLENVRVGGKAVKELV